MRRCFTVHTSVSVPKGVGEDLTAYAEAQGLSKSAVVTEALKGYLSRKKG